MKANTIIGLEPHILVGESEVGGVDGIGLGETRQDRNVDQLLDLAFVIVNQEGFLASCTLG